MHKPQLLQQIAKVLQQESKLHTNTIILYEIMQEALY